MTREPQLPRGLALYPFQATGAAWLRSRRAGLLADQPGLGKTVQALMAAPVGAPLLVICPAVVKGNWAAECRRFRPDFEVEILEGRKSFRWPLAGECLISNYDILPENPAPPHAATVIVADEAHALKSFKALRTKRFRAMSKAVAANRGQVLLLTGTPMTNRPPELWGVLEAGNLAREAFGSWPRFVHLFGGRKGRFGIEWGTPSPLVPDLLRRVMLCRRRAEVLPDLPIKTYRTVVAPIDADTRRICDELLAALVAAGIDLDRAIETAIETRGTVPGFEALSLVRERLATAKLPTVTPLLDDLEAADEPVVVFSRHLAPVKALAQRPGWAAISGDVPNAERTEIVRRFEAGELRGIVATIGAGGVGITLVRACHLIFVDLDWTPALNEQAEDRCCRIGQTRGVVVTRLEADHAVDQRVIALLSQKQALIAATVEAAAVPADWQPPVSHVKHDGETRAGEGTVSVQVALPRCNPADSPVPISRFRPPVTESEIWALEAILTLADRDEDRAQEHNGVGFNKFDGTFGHSLADQIRDRGTLSAAQWQAAIKIARRYPKQVGREPMEAKQA